MQIRRRAQKISYPGHVFYSSPWDGVIEHHRPRQLGTRTVFPLGHLSAEHLILTVLSNIYAYLPCRRDVVLLFLPIYYSLLSFLLPSLIGMMTTIILLLCMCTECTLHQRQIPCVYNQTWSTKIFNSIEYCVPIHFREITMKVHF